MALEYAILFSCPVRRIFSEKHIRELGRVSSFSSSLIFASIENNLTPSQEIVNFLEDHSKEVNEVERIASICKVCVASVSSTHVEHLLQESIGCLGRIYYPIDELFEKFLANRTQLLLDILSEEDWPRMLHVALDRDTPFDGERSRTLRRVITPTGLRFFERTLSIQLSRKGRHISTDNLFDIFQGFYDEESGSSYTRELPVIVLSDYIEFLQMILLQNLEEGEQDKFKKTSRTYSEFLRFQDIITRADELQAKILME